MDRLSQIIEKSKAIFGKDFDYFWLKANDDTYFGIPNYCAGIVTYSSELKIYEAAKTLPELYELLEKRLNKLKGENNG